MEERERPQDGVISPSSWHTVSLVMMEERAKPEQTLCQFAYSKKCYDVAVIRARTAAMSHH